MPVYRLAINSMAQEPNSFGVHAALREGRIKGAALDVCEVEPLPEDSPLWALDNVLLSPHCADRTAQFQVCARVLFEFCNPAKAARTVQHLASRKVHPQGVSDNPVLRSLRPWSSS